MSDDNKNPSSGTSGAGVLDHLKGAKSKDPDLQYEETESAAHESAETKPDGAEAPKQTAEKGSDSEVRLRQRAALLERQLAELGPYAQLGIALANDPSGQELVEKIQRGEPVFGAKGREATEHLQETRGLTRAELADELNRRDAAKRQIDELYSLAGEKLSHFNQIRKNAEFQGFVDASLAATWNGTIPVDPEVADWTDVQAARNFTALKMAHEMYLMRNPKVRDAVKEAGRKEASERAGAVLAGELGSGSTSNSSSQESKLSPEEEVIQRMLNVRGRGKSFSSIGRKR
jgi:hypothetical protein